MPEPASPPQAGPVDVAETLHRLRLAVRQRMAEAATLGSEAGGVQGRLLALRDLETVREPVPLSARPGLGRLVVAARKAVHHLFLKWLVRPLVAQQNQFNEAAAQAVEEMAAELGRLRRELERQAAELERLRAEAATRERGSGG